MHVSAVTGSVQLCVFQQWCDPGKGAPTHLHAVEEVLTVLDGEAEIWIEEERTRLTAGQSMVDPGGPQARLPQRRRAARCTCRRRWRRRSSRPPSTTARGRSRRWVPDK